MLQGMLTLQLANALSGALLSLESVVNADVQAVGRRASC